MADPSRGGAFFDRWSATFERDRMSTWFQHYQTRVVDRVAEIGGRELLDVGCGTGWLLRRAARRLAACRLAGADLSRGMLARARETARQEGQEAIGFVQADAGALPFAPASFDCVTCTASFHHYRDPLAVLRSWRRLLRPGGRLLLLESCTTYLPIWLYDRVLRVLERGHVRYYRTVDLVRLTEEAGFRNVRPLWREHGMFCKGKLFSSQVLVEGVVP
ncbi:MAG: class I SAM-dependent methyltransferase [Planctomycetes bacterium]|nr:class I SAM-dependent methyltransferase [Planctomycetota bacterium]